MSCEVLGLGRGFLLYAGVSIKDGVDARDDIRDDMLDWLLLVGSLVGFFNCGRIRPGGLRSGGLRCTGEGSADRVILADIPLRISLICCRSWSSAPRRLPGL